MKELYTQYKGLLFTLAYQLTGSAVDAEDVVQDVFLKIYDVDLDRLLEPKSYLCKMVTNRCRDLLKSAQNRKEQYVGEWLPEPIVNMKDPLEMVVRSERLSYALLVLLEKLSPTERTVFVLREATGFKYSEIASIIGKSEVNCRKLNSRAREKMGVTADTSIQSETESEKWVERFLEALEHDNVDQIISLLAEDVVLVSDGGGKAVSAIHPIRSRNIVAKFLVGLYRKASFKKDFFNMEIKVINGQTGLIIRSKEGIDSVVLLHAERNSIRNIYFIRNPDKLKYL
ncbi:RNA polymerase sigma-70 factor [Rossellomorea sp. NS-SX7]|uniref:RNA polymerase sigma-70 factor n=1 Tax=Rossellomorea sp. NS-SX7 TaxID=3463856 RepID=UPI004058BC53